MQFTLKHLRYFVAAAERGSVTAAARAIHVSQPSISEAIAHLEDVFDLQLFLRHHAQGLSPTPAGRRLLLEARSLLAHADDLEQSARGLADALAGDLDVGCFITFASLLMPGLLGAFAARFPGYPHPACTRTIPRRCWRPCAPAASISPSPTT